MVTAVDQNELANRSELLSLIAEICRKHGSGDKCEAYLHNSERDKFMYDFVKLFPLEHPLPEGPVLHSTPLCSEQSGHLVTTVKTYATAITYDLDGKRAIILRRADGCYPRVARAHGERAIVITYDDADPKRDPEEICYALVYSTFVVDLKWSGNPPGTPSEVGYRCDRHKSWYFQLNGEEPTWCCDSLRAAVFFAR